MADIQPDIALGIRPPPPGPSMSDTIGMASHLGQLQQSINANQAFQQEQQARSAAGTLIASGLKGDALISAMQKNPGIGAYAPQLMQEQATLANTLLANQNADLSNRGTVASGYLKSLAANLANPNAQQMDANQKAYEAGLPDDLRAATQSARDATNKALTYGLDLSKPDDQATYRQRLIGMATSANITPQTVEQNLGSSGLQDGLNVRKAPIQFGGQTELIGQGQGGGGGQSGTAPSSAAPANALGASGRISFTPQGAADSGAAPQAGTPPAMAPAKAVTQAPIPLNVPPPGPDGKLPAGWGVPDGAPKGTPPTRIAADGTALFTPDMVSPSLNGLKDFKGAPARTDDQIATNRQRLADFNGPGLQTFQGAQVGLSRLQDMTHDLDSLAAGGVLGHTGPGGDTGNQIEAFINRGAELFGGKPVFNPQDIASAESFRKNTINLAGALTKGLGQESQAALQDMTKAVPSLDNTYLGGRMIIATTKALLQREIDKREYINAWAQNPANQGAIDGAEEKFNSLHPASSYADKVYDHFGMSQNGGFRDPAVIFNDIKQGYLTSEQGQNLVRANFPDFKNSPKEQAAILARVKQLQQNGVDNE